MDPPGFFSVPPEFLRWFLFLLLLSSDVVVLLPKQTLEKGRLGGIGWKATASIAMPPTTSKCIEDTFEKTQRRKAKQMPPNRVGFPPRLIFVTVNFIKIENRVLLQSS